MTLFQRVASHAIELLTPTSTLLQPWALNNNHNQTSILAAVAPLAAKTPPHLRVFDGHNHFICSYKTPMELNSFRDTSTAKESTTRIRWTFGSPAKDSGSRSRARRSISWSKLFISMYLLSLKYKNSTECRNLQVI